MKPTQDFNAENLLWMKGRRLSPLLRSKAPKTKEEWNELAEITEEQITTGKFQYEGLYSSISGGKPTLSTTSISDALVLRKINSNIRRAYGIRQTNRTYAVRLAKQALGEWTPKGIVALDLKSCFESIAPSSVLRKLRHDAKISSQTIVLLEKFFKQSNNFGGKRHHRGLARGILISSTLAELYLKSIDDKISLIPGVYVYTRYVDDMLIIASRPASEIYREVSNVVSNQGLQINQAKQRVIDVGCECAFQCKHAIGTCPCQTSCQCTRDGNRFNNFEYVDYLGYRIIFYTGNKLKKSITAFALIAPKKINKIKTRIENSIKEYNKTRDFNLLYDRICFLTSNILIDESIQGAKLRSGIAYIYSEYSEPPQPHPYSKSTLESLDKYLHTRLRILAMRGSLTYMQKILLRKRSFSSAFQNRIRGSFTADRTSQIKSCWVS